MDLCEDTIFHNIFSRLPAKSVCKLRLVCKSFNEFSKENYFGTKQAQNSLAQYDTCFFIEPKIQRFNFNRVELHPLPGQQPSSGASSNVLRFLSDSARVLASNNGLILCCITENEPLELFICNPVTQSWSPISTPRHLRGILSYSDVNVVLECDNHESFDDYSVFLFERPQLDDWSSSYECRVYRAKEGAWKRMKRDFLAGGRRMAESHMPVHHNGALHFISDYGSSNYFTGSSPYSRPYIMTYNLHSGLSTTLELPREARFECGANMGIFRWGEVSSSTRSICLVRLRKSIFTVWFLRDYESGLWQRALKIRVRAMGIKEKYPNITGFTVMNGNVLVFATKRKVYTYGLKGDRYKRFEEIGEHRCGPDEVCFVSYSDTLRSCGTEATTLLC